MGLVPKYMYVLSNDIHICGETIDMRVTPPTHSEVWNFEVGYNYFDLMIPAHVPPKYLVQYFSVGDVLEHHKYTLMDYLAKEVNLLKWYCNQSVHANLIANS